MFRFNKYSLLEYFLVAECIIFVHEVWSLTSSLCHCCLLSYLVPYSYKEFFKLLWLAVDPF